MCSLTINVFSYYKCVLSRTSMMLETQQDSKMSSSTFSTNMIDTVERITRSTVVAVFIHNTPAQVG